MLPDMLLDDMLSDMLLDDMLPDMLLDDMPRSLPSPSSGVEAL